MMNMGPELNCLPPCPPGGFPTPGPTLAAVAAQAIVDFRRTGISPPGPTTPATREAAPPLPPAPQRGDPAAMDQTTPAAGAPPAPTPTPQPGTQRWAGPPSRALSQAAAPLMPPGGTVAAHPFQSTRRSAAVMCCRTASFGSKCWA